MNLYGSDMDESVSPLESGLGWTVAWEPADRDYVGRTAIESRRGDPANRRFVGLLLTGRGVLRDHLRVFSGGKDVGEITSGGFSPTLGRSIGLARVRGDITGQCAVEIRGKHVEARVVKPPFVRNGEAKVEL
jgi:aminomethyltransferase